MAPPLIFDTSNPEVNEVIIGTVTSPTDITPSHHHDILANLVCRVVFGILANVVCWVPLRLLHRNGEFAAVVFITTVMILNTLTVINALIWRSDNTSSWWDGVGYCDVHIYIYFPLTLVFATSNFAIMKNLADQLALVRANSLSVREKRRKSLWQALIIFPWPLLQAIFVYPVSSTRYQIGTLIGCTTTISADWLSLVIYVLPHPIFALGSAIMAVLTFVRFRDIRKLTQTAIHSNTTAQSRTQRARRRLYFMTLSVLVPYLPLTLAFMVGNLQSLMPMHRLDFKAIKAGPLPYNTVVFIPSTKIDFFFMNSRWIPILTAIPIFGFFGLTKDAINSYRRQLVAVGLARLFPLLREEYDPDRTTRGSSQSRSMGSTSTSRAPLNLAASNTSATEKSLSSRTEDRNTISTISEQGVPDTNHLENTLDLEIGSPDHSTTRPTKAHRAQTPVHENPLPHTNFALDHSTRPAFWMRAGVADPSAGSGPNGWAMLGGAIMSLFRRKKTSYSLPLASSSAVSMREWNAETRAKPRQETNDTLTRDTVSPACPTTSTPSAHDRTTEHLSHHHGSVRTSVWAENPHGGGGPARRGNQGVGVIGTSVVFTSETSTVEQNFDGGRKGRSRQSL